MTVRAVYLKLNNDLSPNSFIMTLRRLKSRQGHVRVIRSDKGTNLSVAAPRIKGCIQNNCSVKGELLFLCTKDVL